MRTAGLDIATCTGMALVDDVEGDEWGKTVHLPDQRGFERLQLIAAGIKDTLQVWGPDLVLIESYAFFRNVNSFITLVELGTVIRMALYDLKWPWCEVNPVALKKWTTGKGNAKKDQMALAVKQRWGYESPSSDIIDAYALAQMGQLGIHEIQKIPGVFLQHR